MATRMSELFHCACLLLLLGLVSLPLSCEAFTMNIAQNNASALMKPIMLLEKGEPCISTDLRRLGPEGTIEKLSDSNEAALIDPQAMEGTWIYLGRTSRGTVKGLVVQGASTPLPEINFEAALEIQPVTHPVDIRPSSDRMQGRNRFSFIVLSRGKPVQEPVRYCASRLGSVSGSDNGSGWAETDRETLMGKGRVYIDEPGIWWITAETILEEGDPIWASLTFTVPEGPGPDHFAAFTKAGRYLDTWDQIVEALAHAEVVFLGEKHDDPVAHWLEKEILAAVHRARGDVALSLEMFDRDVQPVLDGYLRGDYMERHFLDAARPWPRYSTDYRPMVEYAREHGLPVVAANAPRRLVNLVTRRGPDELKKLPESELKWLPPLDYHIPEEGRYVEKLRSTLSVSSIGAPEESLPGPRHKRDWKAKGCPELSAYNDILLESGKEDKGMPGGMPHSMMMMSKMSKGFPSQSLWDAAMAHSIARFLENNPAATVVQVNGAFHSDEHLGTVEQLLRYRPETRIAVISMLPAESFPAFDQENMEHLGDIIIVTDPTWQPDEDR